MRLDTIDSNNRRRATRGLLWPLAFAATFASATDAGAQVDSTRKGSDPRVGLRGGWMDAAEAARSLRVVAHRPRPEGFVNPAAPGDFGFANSDLAFRGNYVFQGSFNGFQIWDISNPSSPTVRTKFVCPGGQGDPSIHGNLLFISVEMPNGRVDCGTQGIADTVSAERFRGVRIFDVSDIDHPKQIAAVQTCRGSHTHTLVSDPKDPKTIYVYVSGTSFVRPAAELPGCSGRLPEEDPNTSLFRIDIIRVPLDSPQTAKIINSPRIFADAAQIGGLWKGGAHGAGTQNTAQTNQCHDITVYTAIGLAAGACAGNGILLDIRDPANPKRVAEVSDPNFAYWHSSTFSNDGKKVLFTDEWGGGTQPRCRSTDKPEWGADAIFTIDNGKLAPGGYFKIPAPQTAQENCVAHNGSLIPVPGRDIMVQGWYQGGLSVFDFTDAMHPVEIAFFDRGPIDTTLVLGGHWAGYWYNGHIYASEIARGLDVLDLEPSEHLSRNEIEAAKLVRLETFNPQDQPKLVWPASFVVARAYLDQLGRNNGLARDRAAAVGRELDRVEQLSGAARQTALSQLAVQLDKDVAGAADRERVRALAGVVRGIGR
jgi:hypothetical protein